MIYVIFICSMLTRTQMTCSPVGQPPFTFDTASACKTFLSQQLNGGEKLVHGRAYRHSPGMPKHAVWMQCMGKPTWTPAQ